MSRYVIPAIRLAVVLALAIAVGFGAAVVVAMIGHEVLVSIYGEDLAYIDDTPPMFIAVATSYLTLAGVSLVTLVVGWRRFVRRPPAE